MAIRIENTFVVPAPLEQAWAILTNVPLIAPCMPGAELTDVIDERTYKGIARVKIGPMQLAFGGEARLTECDAAAGVSKLSIRGADSKGRGNVQSEMTFALRPEGSDTRVHVTTELVLSGPVAQYGRGIGLIKEMCNQFAAQFARNLAQKMASGDLSPAAANAKPISAMTLVSGAVRAMVGRKADAPEPGEDSPGGGGR